MTGTTDPEIDSVTCISCKFDHQMAPLAFALVANLATTTWIGLKFGHQVASLALFAKLATRLCNLHCHIALDCPIGIIS